MANCSLCKGTLENHADPDCQRKTADERDRYKAALEYIEETYRTHGATNEVAYQKAKAALDQSTES